jgi:putative Holliday junction resolvase
MTSSPSKILALDYGEKRIGLATSGFLGMGNLLPPLLRERNAVQKDLQKLQKILHDEQIQEIVVGLPKNMNNTLGFKAQEVLNFVEQLKTITSLPIHLWDERLTTQQAQQQLQDLPPKKRKLLVDSVAARLIVESFVAARLAQEKRDSLRNEEEHEEHEEQEEGRSP